MNEHIAKIYRLLENMLRLGTVEEVKQGYCRVKTGNILLDWRPYWTQRAGSAKTSWRPSRGEQVLIFSPGGDFHGALIGPAFYSDENDQPDEHETRNYVEYPDGAKIIYDPENSKLIAEGIKTALVQASETVTVDCPETQTTGNLTVKGKLVVEGESLFQGHNTMNGGTTISGDAEIDGIKFSEHKHTGDSGGKTGVPE
ncbi:phage baseplate assembly protein V [Shewanella sp.]|uniref:phage baseplate assembly protein V n=1 Tax=Shewanella sp. TaxID=50422 RepID=UPI00356222F8